MYIQSKLFYEIPKANMSVLILSLETPVAEGQRHTEINCFI